MLCGPLLSVFHYFAIFQAVRYSFLHFNCFNPKTQPTYQTWHIKVKVKVQMKGLGHCITLTPPMLRMYIKFWLRIYFFHMSTNNFLIFKVVFFIVFFFSQQKCYILSQSIKEYVFIHVNKGKGNWDVK